MNIQELISLVNNRITNLENQKALAFQDGNIDMVNNLDNDILSAKSTLNKLETL